MLTPEIELDVGGTTFETGSVHAVHLKKEISGGADELVVTVAAVTDFTGEPDDEVSLKMGWSGSTETVFTGTVTSVEHGISVRVITAHGSQMALMTQRTTTTFVDQNAGDVFNALGSEAGASIGNVENGIALPRYFVTESGSLYDHAMTLAQLSGVDLFTDSDGALCFATPDASLKHSALAYGRDIIRVNITRKVPLVNGVRVFPESPSSNEGNESAGWLVKQTDPIKGEAGEAPFESLSVAVCATKEAAETAAAGRLNQIKRQSVRGHVLILGNPALTPGDRIEIEDVPEDNANGTFRIAAIDHTFNTVNGFITRLCLEGDVDGGF